MNVSTGLLDRLLGDGGRDGMQSLSPLERLNHQPKAGWPCENCQHLVVLDTGGSALVQACGHPAVAQTLDGHPVTKVLRCGSHEPVGNQTEENHE